MTVHENPDIADREILKEIKREDIPDIGEENNTLVKFGQALFNEAQHHKVDELKLHEKWSRARRWVDGDQWEKQRDAHLAMPVTNFIFANCETIQSLTVNTRPILEIESSNFQKAQEIREIIDNNLWYRLGIPRTRKLVMKDFVQLGNGFIKTIWDPFDLNGQGELSLNYTDPYALFPQPHQPNLQDCKYVDHVFPVYISELIDIYGNIALQLSPEDVSGKLKKPKNQKIGLFRRLGQRILSPVTDTKGIMTDSFEGRTGVSQVVGREKNMVLFHELWYKDSRLEDIVFPDNDRIADEHLSFSLGNIPSVNFEDDHATHIREHRNILDTFPSKNDDTNNKTIRERVEEHILTHESYPDRSKRIKYEGGRVISFAQDIILDDKENPFLHGRFPWAHYKNYERGDQFWADGEVEQMMSPQEVHNRMEAIAIDHAVLTGNTPIVVSTDANIEEETIVNAQGAIYTVDGDVNKAITRLPPAQLTADVPFLMQNSKIGTKEVSGVPESIQGIRPTGITSGKALDSLKASALNRISPKIEQLMFGDQEMYEQMLKLMGQFYKEDRIFHTIGENGKQQDIVLSPDDFKDEFIVRLRSREELGANPESRMQIALVLIQIGAMTPDLLLEYVDLPGFSFLKQKYLERQNQLAGLPPEETGANSGNGQGAQNRNPAGEILGQQNLGTNLPGV